MFQTSHTTLHHSPHYHTDRLANQRRPLVDVARLRGSGNGNGYIIRQVPIMHFATLVVKSANREEGGCING